ncbi:MAG: helix-turn-helix domain-containing protein [Campylobacterota bacterium]
MTKLITYRDIEKIYGLKKNTLTKLYMKGEFIPAIKVGNRNYFEVEKLEKWIESKKVDIAS